MKKVLCGIVISLLMLICSETAYSQKGIKIGVVEVETIVKEMPEAAMADQKLKDLQASYIDTLKKMEEGFTIKMEQYTKQKGMMTPEQQKKEEELLQKLQIDYSRFQQEKLGQQGQLAIMRGQLLEPIREKVREAIKKVALKEKMNFVFDKNSPMLLYTEDKFDITYDVLALIKRNNK